LLSSTWGATIAGMEVSCDMVMQSEQFLADLDPKVLDDREAIGASFFATIHPYPFFSLSNSP
jgi:hypothetical protein